MWWKIYFLILALLFVISMLMELPTIASWNFALWLSNIEVMLLFIGLFSYVFKKQVLNKISWKYIFFAMVIDTLLHIVYLLTKSPLLSFLDPNTVPRLTLLTTIIGIIFAAPGLLAVYRLGFSAKKKK